MNLKINNRLRVISDFVCSNDLIIDVGCDHGLLGIYVYLKYRPKKIISSDINTNPLANANENIIKYGLEGRIKTKLGDGLEPIEDDINTVIISGMGGRTIIDILKNVYKYPKVFKLIISPNNDFALTREEISKLGFHLCSEKMVCDHDKYYLVSHYEKGNIEKINKTFGKLDLKDTVNRAYFEDVIKKNKAIVKSLPNKYLLKKIKIKLNNIYIKRKLSI